MTYPIKHMHMHCRAHPPTLDPCVPVCFDFEWGSHEKLKRDFYAAAEKHFQSVGTTFSARSPVGIFFSIFRQIDDICVYRTSA